VKKTEKKEIKKAAKVQDKKAVSKPDSDEEAEPVKLIETKGAKVEAKAKESVEKEDDGSGLDVPDSDEEPEAKKAPVKKEVAKSTKPAAKKEEPKKTTKPVSVKKEVKKQVKEESNSSVDESDIEDEEEAEPKKEVKAKAEPTKKPVKGEETKEEEEAVEDNQEENEVEEEAKEEEDNKEEEEENVEEQEKVKDNGAKPSEGHNNERKVFISNLPFRATEDQISEFFAYYGPVEFIKLSTRDGKPSGNAFITFKEAEDAAKAVVGSGEPLDGRPIKVRYASENPALKEAPKGSTTIFIGSLSYNSTTESVTELFSGCGNIIRARVGTDPEGNPRGFAHVEFDSEEAVTEALKFNGQDLDGRKIRVDVARSKGEKPQGNLPPRSNQRPTGQRPTGQGPTGQRPSNPTQRRFTTGPPRSTGPNIKNKGIGQTFAGKKTRLE